jgi:hypothetical protein
MAILMAFTTDRVTPLYTGPIKSALASSTWTPGYWTFFSSKNFSTKKLFKKIEQNKKAYEKLPLKLFFVNWLFKFFFLHRDCFYEL